RFTLNCNCFNKLGYILNSVNGTQHLNRRQNILFVQYAFNTTAILRDALIKAQYGWRLPLNYNWVANYFSSISQTENHLWRPAMWVPSPLLPYNRLNTRPKVNKWLSINLRF